MSLCYAYFRLLCRLADAVSLGVLQVPVVTLLHALPQLVDVGILCGFALLIFGIVGVQMFAGVLRNRYGMPAESFTATVAVCSGLYCLYHRRPLSRHVMPPACGPQQFVMVQGQLLQMQPVERCAIPHFIALAIELEHTCAL